MALALASAGMAFSQTNKEAEDEATVTVSAELETERRQVYVNEILTMTLRITATGTQIGQAIDYIAGPEADALELGSFDELPDETSLRDGVVHRIRRFRVSGRVTRAGPLRIAPRLKLRLVQRRRMLIGSMWQETPRRVAVDPMDVMVLPLPAGGRPDDWSGAIGAFEFRASASPREVAVGDLVTVRMAVRGEGYREGMTAPAVSPGRQFKAYDPKQVSADEQGVVCEQIVIPQTTNAVSIPAVHFSFFDPRAKAYRTVTRGPFRLRFQEKTVEERRVFRPERSLEGGAPPSGQGAAARRRESVRTVVKILGAALVVAVFIVGGVRLLQRRYRAAGLAFAVALVLVIALAAIRRASCFDVQVSTVGRETVVRFAPSASAMPLFTLGKGVPIQIIETAGTWTRIRRGEDSGWIPTGQLRHDAGDAADRPGAAE